jgi:hypothetical protein
MRSSRTFPTLGAPSDRSALDYSNMSLAEATVTARRSERVSVSEMSSLAIVAVNLLFASDRLLSRAVRAVIDAIVATVPAQTRKAIKGVAR